VTTLSVGYLHVWLLSVRHSISYFICVYMRACLHACGWWGVCVDIFAFVRRERECVCVYVCVVWCVCEVCARTCVFFVRETQR